MAAMSISKAVVLILLYFLSYSSCDGRRPPKQAAYYRAELIRRDSPSMEAAHNLTIPQRVRRSVERSHVRLEKLEAMARGGAAHFFSPLISVDEEFVMRMGVGNPNRTIQHLVVDTGSDLIWVQCGPCIKCYKQWDALYNSHRSSTYRNVSCNSKFCRALDSKSCSRTDTCSYFSLYSDGSNTTGTLASETFSLKRSASVGSVWEPLPGIAFGCGNRQLGNFGVAAGIVGLGRGALSLVSQLGETIKHKFSYCLGSVDDQSGTSSLYLGEAHLPGILKSTPFMGVNESNYYSSFYYLDLHGISVGGTSIDYPPATFVVDSDGNGGLIIDSGTTMTYLAPAAYKPFLEAVKSSIKAKPVNASSVFGTDLCYRSTLPVSKLPRVAFHFAGNATFIVPPRSSFLLMEDDMGRELLCLAYYSGGSLSVFGNTQQQNYNIIYDMGKNKLSFAPAVCDNLLCKKIGVVSMSFCNNPAAACVSWLHVVW